MTSAEGVGKRPTESDDEDELEALAREALGFFREIAEFARAQLDRPSLPSGNVFAAENTFTGNALSLLQNIEFEKREDLHHLCEEPALARLVVRDDEDELRTIYITRVTPHGPPIGGVQVASYRSPLGRLAAAAVGSDEDINIRGEVRSFEVRNRAAFKPTDASGDWDSRPTEVRRANLVPLTIQSLRSLLLEPTPLDAELTLLADLLGEDRAPNVSEGLHRSVIRKMELRDQPLLDQYQDSIFRLPISSRLVLLGPPGTGKTTTLIKRLGLKVDFEHLEPQEVAAIERSAAGLREHRTSWILFTPTELLKLYVKEIFSSEEIPAPDSRIQTWDTFRWDLARTTFGILRTSGTRGAIFKNNLQPLQPDADQIQWCEDFLAWNASRFWTDLQTAASQLANDQETSFGKLGQRLSKLLAKFDGPSATSLSALDRLSTEVADLASTLRDGIEETVRRSFAAQLRNDRELLDSLLTHVTSLNDVLDPLEDTELVDVDDDDEDEAPRTLGREDAFAAYGRAIRAAARARLAKRAVPRKTRNGQILEWLGARIPSQDELTDLGQRLAAAGSLRVFSNPARRFINQIPFNYRRFRRDRQAEGAWYVPDPIPANHLAPLEVDAVILAILRVANELLKEPAIADRINSPRLDVLNSVRSLWRNQILVDEATDFSPLQLACMAALQDPAVMSLFACGDFNQRMTTFGVKSRSQLAWALPGSVIEQVDITYRHSRQLAEFAELLIAQDDDQTPSAQLPPDVNSDAVRPVLGIGLSGDQAIDWLAQRIREIDSFIRPLPSVAVLVNCEGEVGPLAEKLQAALSDENIRVEPCKDGKSVGLDSHVRVFDVQHIKGLEFEAVFFLAIDELATAQPDLFDKYLYVGVTRAATYLGITCAGPELPRKLSHLSDLFDQNWPRR